MYKINDTASLYNYRVKKACQKCGKEVSFDQKFCGVCGAPLDTPTKDVNNEVNVRRELEDVGKACLDILAKKYGVRLKEDASILVAGRIGENHATSVGKYDLCCEKCCEPIHLYQSFCTECGIQLNVPDELTTELTWEEVEAIILAKFYEQNPTLRPIQEQEYRVSVAVYRKWNGSADFEAEPPTELEMVASADGVVADIATHPLLEDFDKDGALYASLKDPLNETIEGILKDWDKCSEFRKDDTFTVNCSLGDLHEFLVDICITKID